MKKITIVGSGISGLSLARMLAPSFEITLLEATSRLGGLIKCDRVNGNLFHRVGGHVFNSRNQQVLDWFWQHFDQEKEFTQAKRNAKILLNGQLIGYPLEDHLYQLDEITATKIIDELLTMMVHQHDSPPTYTNFKDFLIGNFGTSLYELYFGPYNTKIWNTDISKVPLEWLEGKLPMPKLKEVILHNLLRRKEAQMVHSSFYYARRNGSQFIVDRLAEGIPVHLNSPLKKITAVGRQRLIVNDFAFTTDKVVYCGDIRKLSTIVQIDDEELKSALKAVETFDSNGTSNVLCETDANELSWLYIPESTFKAHRIIYTGNFSETNNEGTERKTCVVEFSGHQSKEDMVKEIQKLPGNLKPLAFNYEPNSYIIHNESTRIKVKQVKEVLFKYNIFLLGRFAEWEYFNMDKCIESAMELATELKKDIITYEKNHLAN